MNLPESRPGDSTADSELTSITIDSGPAAPTGVAYKKSLDIGEKYQLEAPEDVTEAEEPHLMMLNTDDGSTNYSTLSENSTTTSGTNRNRVSSLVDFYDNKR